MIIYKRCERSVVEFGRYAFGISEAQRSFAATKSFYSVLCKYWSVNMKWFPISIYMKCTWPRHYISVSARVPWMSHFARLNALMNQIVASFCTYDSAVWRRAAIKRAWRLSLKALHVRTLFHPLCRCLCGQNVSVTFSLCADARFVFISGIRNAHSGPNGHGKSARRVRSVSPSFVGAYK